MSGLDAIPVLYPSRTGKKACGSGLRLPSPFDGIRTEMAATGAKATAGAPRSARPSEFDLFSDLESVVDFDAEVSHGALELGMPEEQLNRAKVPGLTVDLCSLRPPHGVGAETRGIESDVNRRAILTP